MPTPQKKLKQINEQGWGQNWSLFFFFFLQFPHPTQLSVFWGKVSRETSQFVPSAVSPGAKVSWLNFPFFSLLTHRYPQQSWAQFYRVLLITTHAPGHTKSTLPHFWMLYQIYILQQSNVDTVRRRSFFCIYSKFLSD